MHSVEDMSRAVSVPFSTGNMICNRSPASSHIEISGCRRFPDNRAVSSLNRSSKQNMHCDQSISARNGSYNFETGSSGLSTTSEDEMKGRESALSSCEFFNRQSESLGDDQSLEHSHLPSVSGKEQVASGSNCDWKSPTPMDTEPCVRDPSLELQPVEEIVAVDIEGEDDDGNDPKPSETPLEVLQEKKIVRTSSHSIFEMDSAPRYGVTSVCGRRPEMEDAVAVVPRFTQIPSQMLVDDQVLNQNLGQVPAHFFGVYDGHGGSQVADYCSKRIHLALAEEVEQAKSSLSDEYTGDGCKELWRKAFSNCFLKVDAEMGGSGGSAGSCRDDSEAQLAPIIPETVGSTAVAAVVCPTHVIVGNCGDSRAVLCRGKTAIPLSVDHKPDREDEYARIEAAGGKIIQWNGSRVFGVLAMSRSIGTRLYLSTSLLDAFITLPCPSHGDRYLKPWIIPDPEVMFFPRAKEDECFVLASDGLWDVLTNQEACDIARKAILLWHKRNGDASSPPQKAEGVDPAAQAAAQCLAKIALQKGSKDNITVIVVDLKAHRKFRRKAQC
ncbi:hypothetical protein Tsubulata_003250 [Turnera subulata]|uniref:protein-serine/threonine phosphatase n=1 Tax=Turnera subulata TaxID=218843 RepID=A0A9Q0JQ57_9ROSI|nr:hypothetical protein Tsubulata_003250 [Turnera subulata]